MCSNYPDHVWGFRVVTDSYIAHFKQKYRSASVSHSDHPFYLLAHLAGPSTSPQAQDEAQRNPPCPQRRNGVVVCAGGFLRRRAHILRGCAFIFSYRERNSIPPPFLHPPLRHDTPLSDHVVQMYGHLTNYICIS